MATRARDGTQSTERRGRSPSTGGTTLQRSSPSTSKRSSPAKSHDSSTTANSTKNIPNYLRSTISSGLDVSKPQAKKPILGDNANKLLRRRSFDKPPPPSHSQITRVSPSPTLRSSSFSGKKVVSSPKMAPDKNLRATRESSKQHSMYGASAIKRSNNFVKKGTRVVSASSTKEHVTNPSEKSESTNIPHDISEHDTHFEEKESIVSEAAEQTVHDECNEENNTDAKYSSPEDQEIIKVEQNEVETVHRDENDVSIGIKSEDKSYIEETKNQHESKEFINDVGSHDAKDEKVSNNLIQEPDENELEEGIILDAIVDEELKEIEVPEKEMQVSENAVVKEHVTENEEQEEKQETEKIAMEEKKETKSTTMEEKKETKNVAPRQQMVYGKKDSVVSNDLIEETASKLREQRKNKVKALAGAFETVISLQDPK